MKKPRNTSTETAVNNPPRTALITARERKRHKPTPAARILAVSVLILLVFLLVSGLFKSIVTRFLITIVPYETSVLEEKITVDFLVIRQETPVSAPFGGDIELVAQEGERVAKKTVVAYLTKNSGSSLEKTEKVALLSPLAGILSYRIDGYESILTPQVFPELDRSKLPKMQEQDGKPGDKQLAGEDVQRKTVAGGEFFYKIVDNLAFCNLYTEGVENLPERLGVGDRVDLRIDNLDNLSVNSRIEGLARVDGEARILFSIPFITGIENFRTTGGKIIVGKHSGMVVADKVLVTRDGEKGVYLLEKGRVLWQPVQVIAEAEDKAVLQGLRQGDWIIATPGLVSEGQRVFSLH